jgi:hypothetical protein
MGNPEDRRFGPVVYGKRFVTGFAKITLALAFTAFLDGFLTTAQEAPGVLFLDMIRELLINFPLNIAKIAAVVHIYTIPDNVQF